MYLALGSLAPSCGCCLESTATFSSAADVCFFLRRLMLRDMKPHAWLSSLWISLPLGSWLLCYRFFLLLLFPSFPGGSWTELLRSIAQPTLPPPPRPNAVPCWSSLIPAFCHSISAMPGIAHAHKHKHTHARTTLFSKGFSWNGIFWWLGSGGGFARFDLSTLLSSHIHTAAPPGNTSCVAVAALCSSIYSIILASLLFLLCLIFH